MSDGQNTSETDNKHVYFVQPVAGGPIKIGVATDIDKRLDGLCSMSPVPIRLLYALRGAGTATEKRLHVAAARHRLHGEWFDNSPAVLRLVDLAMRDGGEEDAERQRVLRMARLCPPVDPPGVPLTLTAHPSDKPQKFWTVDQIASELGVAIQKIQRSLDRSGARGDVVDGLVAYGSRELQHWWRKGYQGPEDFRPAIETGYWW